MIDPEISFDEFGNDYFHESIRTSLRDFGGIVIRNAIAPERCAFYRSLITRTHDLLETKCAEEGHPFHEARDEDHKLGGWRSLAYELREGQLPPGIFEQANPGFSIFDLLADLRFGQIMARFFEGGYHISPSAHTRRVSPDSASHSKAWQKPALCHIDAQYHHPQHFSLNFWVPLDDCGIDAPGLQIVRDNVYGTQRFVGYDPVADTFDTEKLEVINERVFDQFDRECLFAPELKVGDVFIIHNWTIHESNCNDRMTNVRQSCELRVNQEGWAFPEKTTA